MIPFIRKYKSFLFFSLLILVYLFVDYQSILFYRPQGMHFIRQTDSLSFVANYFNNACSNLFEPQVFNLKSIDGKAACEFPILYYITALLYSIFGEHEWILRAINISLTSLGFFALFKLLLLLLKDLWYALIFTFLFLSSTVLLYYTNNFQPDASALGLSLIGWYYYFLAQNENKSYLFISLIFFTFSSLLKVTYFINPIAALATLFVSDFLNKKTITSIIRNRLSVWIAFLISAAIILAWNLFAIHYNTINGDHYFLVSTRPIWNMSKEDIYMVWDFVSNYWFSKYYFQSTFHFFGIILILGLLFIRKMETKLLILNAFLLIGSASYILLFLAQFISHDYYFITLIPTLMFFAVSAFIAVRNRFPKLIGHNISKFLLLVLCVLSINYARMKLEDRYQETDDKFAKIGFTLAGKRALINRLGISKDAKLIVVSDLSPNGSLYFLNRKGWTLDDTSKKNLERLDYYKSQGAQYLINTTNTHFDYPEIWNDDKIRIYRLD